MNNHQPTLQPALAGIDDMSIYVPRIFVPIERLAEARNIEVSKLRDGLGLRAMAFPDVHEDVATMAANATLELIQRNHLDPRQIGRIYMGTESSVDNSKPMASYVLEMLTQYFTKDYGPDCFLHCDVVDLTFACIGAVDAMQNTIDWVRGGEGRIGIIVASDVAKYELGSGGEYTQGAGAIATLIRRNPRLITINEHWGVATRGAHDFFKPVRSVSKADLVAEVLRLAGLEHINPEQLLAQIPDDINVEGILDSNEEMLTLHKETPMFDGPYSNQCYQDRIREALAGFFRAQGAQNGQATIKHWNRLAFHLPYAFQARRMFSEIFFEDARKSGKWEAIQAEVAFALPKAEEFDNQAAYEKAYAEFLRAVTKTKSYRQFVEDKIERSERASSLIGNMYTASIFLALMSTLENDLLDGNDLSHTKIGFFAYGSGSKSKVFEGTVQEGWKAIVSRWGLMDNLAKRQEIDYATYEKLHRGRLEQSVAGISGEFFLQGVCQEKGNYVGARTYQWKHPASKAPVSEGAVV